MPPSLVYPRRPVLKGAFSRTLSLKAKASPLLLYYNHPQYLLFYYCDAKCASEVSTYRLTEYLTFVSMLYIFIEREKERKRGCKDVGVGTILL